MKIKKFVILFLSILCVFFSISLNVLAADGGFGVEDKNGEWTTETHADIFHTLRYNNNLLFPGSGSSYTFKVYNSGERYNACEIKIEDKNEFRIPLEFKLKRNGEYIIGSINKWVESPVLDTGLYKLRGTEEYELEWRWQYLEEEESKREAANKRDTELGEGAFVSDKPYYLNITVYGEGGTDESIPDEPEPEPEPEPESKPEPEPETETSKSNIEPSKPDYIPSGTKNIIDVVLTGDNTWKFCIGLGILMSVSCLVIAVLTRGNKNGRDKDEK